MSVALFLSQPPAPVQTGGVGERPIDVIRDIGTRLRRTRSPGQLHALADAARLRFLAARRRLQDAGGGHDAPEEILRDFQQAAALSAATVFALDPAGRLKQARAVIEATAPVEVNHAR
jgi:hypothetical protein